MMTNVSLQVLPHGADLPLPSYATPGAAGLDLAAAVPRAVVIQPGMVEAIPTGLAIALPEGSEAQVRPRSGLAAKHGITVLNAPGTVDADYRGEIAVLLINHGRQAFVVERGMRIAQLVIAPVLQVQLTQVSALPDTQRGAAGFGSTGLGSLTTGGKP